MASKASFVKIGALKVTFTYNSQHISIGTFNLYFPSWISVWELCT